MSLRSGPRRRGRLARPGGPGLVAAAVAAVAGLSGCGSPAATQTSAAPTTVPAGAPLATSLPTSDGSWALVAMGHQDQPLNTFWEAFYLSGAAGRWAERTPPDVADNGGLVAATTSAGLVIGFRPSLDLHFSPLAVTADGGASYAPGLLPYALSSVPDALSVGPDGQAAALADGELVTSAGGLAGWRPLGGTAAPVTSASASACGVQELTAVAVVGRTVVVGTACAHAAAVGLFQQRGATFVDVGPHLPAADGRDSVEVLRLSRSAEGLAALLRLTDGSTRTYVAAWERAGTASWTLSPPAPAAGLLTSTAVTGAGGFAVLSRASRATMHAAVISPGATSWSQLPDPPAGTATVALSGARVDALAVNDTVFTDYRLLHGQWTRSQTVGVAVPFGSSG